MEDHRTQLVMLGFLVLDLMAVFGEVRRPGLLRGAWCAVRTYRHGVDPPLFVSRAACVAHCI